MWLCRKGLLQTGDAIPDEDGPEPFVLQHQANGVAEAFVVVNDQDCLGGHCFSNSRLGLP